VDKLVTFMGESGVYSIIDAHQDLFARRLCGEGVPNFYAVDLDHNCDYNAVSQLAQTVGMCVPMKDYNFTYDA